MLEKNIPIERLKPDFPCPNCQKMFDDCICTEETNDTGIIEIFSNAFIFLLAIILFGVLSLILITAFN